MLPIAVAVWTVALLCVFVPAAAGWCALGSGCGAIVVLGIVLKLRAHAASRAGLIVVLLAAAAAVSIAVMTAMPARDVPQGGEITRRIGADRAKGRLRLPEHGVK